ncbi:hypothetical protein D5086_033769 [Populus alba]|uniref:Uncharacterized protein n=1 Tax=Populus alba TaxID=43335 RepID=A0ACC4AHP2_POPAL
MPRSQPLVLGFKGLIQYRVGLFCSCPAMESSRREHHLNTRGHEIESFGWSRTADAGNFGVDGLHLHRLLLNFEPVSNLFMSIHASVHSSHKFCLDTAVTTKSRQIKHFNSIAYRINASMSRADDNDQTNEGENTASFLRHVYGSLACTVQILGLHHLPCGCKPHRILHVENPEKNSFNEKGSIPPPPLMDE